MEMFHALRVQGRRLGFRVLRHREASMWPGREWWHRLCDRHTIISSFSFTSTVASPTGSRWSTMTPTCSGATPRVRERKLTSGSVWSLRYLCHEASHSKPANSLGTTSTFLFQLCHSQQCVRYITGWSTVHEIQSDSRGWKLEA